MTKRKIFLLAILVCCAALAAAGTLAYFTAEETAYNVITTGKLAMTLHEETTGGKPFPKEGISGVTPGQIVDKVVYVENTGTVDLYARISLAMSVTGADGKPLPTDVMTLDLNTADWTKQGDCYYYNKPLAPGEKTAPLFKTVTFAADMGNEYMECTAKINVTAQTVQSRNNGDTVLDAQGWPETR